MHAYRGVIYVTPVCIRGRIYESRTGFDGYSWIQPTCVVPWAAVALVRPI